MRWAAALPFAALSAVGVAQAETCFPETAPTGLIGRYFVYDVVDHRGGKRVETAVIAARSEEGGVVICRYRGRPDDALGPLISVIATDERHFFAWSADGSLRRRSEANAASRACDLGIGRCETREPSLRPGAPIAVRIWDRRCEDGKFVKELLGVRHEGGSDLDRRRLDAAAAAQPRLRVEIRYRADGAILSDASAYGGAVKQSRAVAEGAWTGPSCAPGPVS